MVRELYRLEERPGWILTCPFCGGEISYTHLNLYDGEPFLYADGSNDVLLRESDSLKLRTHLAENIGIRAGNGYIEELAKLWYEIERTSPEAPSGGRFKLWSNVKCPHCNKEMPYNNGNQDLAVRLNDPKVILIDGAVVLGDDIDSSWRVKVITTSLQKS